MAGTWLPQTKRAHDALKGIGLKRGQFKVRTRFNNRGDYQPVQVTLKIDREVNLTIANNLDQLMQAGFDVTKVVYGNEGERHYYNVYPTYGPVACYTIATCKGFEAVRRVDVLN